MALRGGTVRAYLQAIQRVATIPGATEHTYRAALGEQLGRAHLLEAPTPADVRFTGEGTNRVEAIHHDVAGSAVRINATQQFTGVSLEAWAWGGSFRPLEHFLTDRKERTLDLDQVRMSLQAITAVRTAIELGPALDAALADVLANPLSFGDGA